MKSKRPLLLTLLLVPSLLVGCTSGVQSNSKHNIDVSYVYNKTYKALQTEAESLKYKQELETIQTEVVKQVERQLNTTGIQVVRAYKSYGNDNYVFTLRKDTLPFSAKYTEGKVLNDYYTSLFSQDLNNFIREDLDLENFKNSYKNIIGFQLRPIYDDGTQFSSIEDIRNQALEGYLVYDFDATKSTNYREQFLRSLWQLKKESRIANLSVFVTNITNSPYRSDIFSDRIRLDDSIMMATNGTPSYYTDLSPQGITLYGAIKEETNKTDYSLEEIERIKRERIDYPSEEGTGNETKN